MNETMPSPPSDVTKTLFRLLKDGEWHNYYEIKDAIAATIPPGPALRKYQNDIEARRRARNDPNYDVPHNDDKRIELGKLRCAQAVMSAWMKDEKRQGVQVRGDGPSKEIRVRPGFVAPWGVRDILEPSDSTEPERAPQDPPFQGQGYTEVPADGFRGSQGEQTTAEEPSPAQPVAVDPEQARPIIRRADGKWASAEDAHPAAGRHAEARAIAHAMTEAPIEIPTVELIPEPEPVGDSASSYDWPPLAPPELPECPDCGVAIRSQTLHEYWHENFVKREELEKATLLTTSQVVDLCRDVIGQELDRFQQGMQLWLEKQFSQVEASLMVLRTQTGKWKANDAWRSHKG